MTPKDILTLLDIVEKSSKTPLYSHITGAAHQALLDVQLHTVPEKQLHTVPEKEEHSPPSKKAKE